MTAENGVAVPANGDQAATGATESKGKGKGVAPAEEVPKDAMQEDDDEEEEENEGGADDDDDEDEEDGMDEIDLNNIIDGGRRTRGRVIDFAKAAEENPPDDDEDEDEDDDFDDPDAHHDKMDED